MKIKTSNLKGMALDWAVAKCRNNFAVHVMSDHSQVMVEPYSGGDWFSFSPSINWAQGGPIIEREEIQISSTPRSEGYWCYAQCMGVLKEFAGPTPLIAAMRCYVASKLGEEVEVPNELIEEI